MASRGIKPPSFCSSKAGRLTSDDNCSQSGPPMFNIEDYLQPTQGRDEVPESLYDDEQEEYEQSTEQENEATESMSEDEKKAYEQWAEQVAEQEVAQAHVRAKERRDRESTKAIHHLVEHGADQELIEYELKKNETDPLDEVQILHDLIENGASDRAIKIQGEYVSGMNEQLEDFDVQDNYYPLFCPGPRRSSVARPLESASTDMDNLLTYSQNASEGECPSTAASTATRRPVYNDNLPSGDELRTYQDRPEQNVATEADVFDITMKVARRHFEEMTPPERNRRRQSLGLPPRPSYLRQNVDPVYLQNIISYPRTQEENYPGSCPGTPRSSRARPAFLRRRPGHLN